MTDSTDVATASEGLGNDVHTQKTFSVPSGREDDELVTDYGHLAEVCSAHSVSKRLSLAELVDGIGAVLHASKGQALSTMLSLGELLACVCHVSLGVLPLLTRITTRPFADALQRVRHDSRRMGALQVF